MDNMEAKNTNKSVGTEKTEKAKDNSKVLTFVVGTNGSDIFKLGSSNSEVSLKDCIEAIGTIKINCLLNFINFHEIDKAIATSRLFHDMDRDIIKNAMNVISDKEVETGEITKEQGESLKKVFND